MLGKPPERPGSGAYWVKSSLSLANGNCVEVASLPDGGIVSATAGTPKGRFSGLHRTNGMHFSAVHETENSTVSADSDRTSKVRVRPAYDDCRSEQKQRAPPKSSGALRFCVSPTVNSVDLPAIGSEPGYLDRWRVG